MGRLPAARMLDNAIAAGLVGFYQGFRALVRAKLAAWHTEDDSVNDHDGWRSRACEYLALAVERRGTGPGRVR